MNEKKTIKLQVYLGDELHFKAKHQAMKSNMLLADWVRKIISKSVDEK